MADSKKTLPRYAKDSGQATNLAFVLVQKDPEQISDQEKQWFREALLGKSGDVGFSPFVGANSHFLGNDGTDQSLLSLACNHGHAWLVPILVTAGANIEFSADSVTGNTPLIYACENGHVDIVRYLLEDLETPANVNVKSSQLTPAIAAARNNHKDVLEILHKHGAQMGIDAGGNNPLTMAVRANAVDAFDWLMDNVVEKEGNHQQTKIGINDGIKPTPVSKQKMDALMAAGALTAFGKQACRDKKHIIKRLVEAGAQSLEEALSRALLNVNLPAVEVLYPIAVKFKPMSRVTKPFRVAESSKENYFIKTIQYLLEQGESLSDLHPSNLILHASPLENIEFLRSVDEKWVDETAARNGVYHAYIARGREHIDQHESDNFEKRDFYENWVAKRVERIKHPDEHFTLYPNDICLLKALGDKVLLDTFSTPYWRQAENARAACICFDRIPSVRRTLPQFYTRMESLAQDAGKDAEKGWRRV